MTTSLARGSCVSGTDRGLPKARRVVGREELPAIETVSSSMNIKYDSTTWRFQRFCANAATRSIFACYLLSEVK